MIVFLHIHKCAGTSLRYMLARSVAPGAIYPVPDLGGFDNSPPYPVQALNPRQVQENLYTGMFDAYEVVMGHFDWQIVPVLPDDAIILVLLRDPIEQLVSQIRWFEQDPKHYGRVAEIARNIGLKDFLRSPYCEKYTNHQTLTLAGRLWADRDLSTGILSYAKRNLKRCVVGLVEHFEASVALFEEATGLDLGPRLRENANPRPATPLGEELRTQIADAQSWDVSLYAYALKHFESQFDDVSEEPAEDGDSGDDAE